MVPLRWKQELRSNLPPPESIKWKSRLGGSDCARVSDQGTAETQINAAASNKPPMAGRLEILLMFTPTCEQAHERFRSRPCLAFQPESGSRPDPRTSRFLLAPESGYGITVPGQTITS